MTQISPLPHRCRISVSGPDAASFLNGLLTLNADKVVEERGVCHYGAFLRPQGKLFADIIAHAADETAIWLDVNREAAPEVLKKLSMYRLRAKVDIQADDTPAFVAFDGPLPDGFISDARAEIIGAPFGFAYGEQTPTATTEDWVHWRLGYGLSDPGHDFAIDQLYAIEANLDLLNAIDFKKGCYIGQELTSRMKRRGPVKNRLLPFSYDNHAPENEAEILSGDMRAGRVIIAAQGSSGGRGLALMRLDRSAGDLSGGNGPIRLQIPAWMAENIMLSNETDALPESGNI